MTRWALPRPGNQSAAVLTRGREAMRVGTDGALDVLHPLIVLARGLGRLATALKQWWQRTPKQRRDPALFVAAAGLLTLSVMPYGPALAAATVLGAAAWRGRDGADEADDPEPDEEETARLQGVYAALVPFFAVPDDPHPEPLFAHDGSWDRAVEEFAFAADGRIGQLQLRYPATFPDGDPAERLRVERLLTAKCGRDREYRFRWDEERNRLAMTVPPPLPDEVAAQRFVTGPGEILLGFTDAESEQRTVPVVRTDGQADDVPPVIWRTGGRSAESHLLAVGGPGAGTSTLLRSVALQSLRHGDLLVVDGGGTGEYACLAGRTGVLAVESSLVGAVAVLEWAALETERRLVAASRARQAGQPVPQDVLRPLWLVLDRPSVLSHLAEAEGRRDPQSLLQVPLRHGRAARVTVVVAEQLDGTEGPGRAVRAYTRTRVVLGAVSHEEAVSVLGSAPPSSPPPHPLPGRGFARVGGGPVQRLQVPATPDPYDESADEAERKAVTALLPDPAPAAAPAGQAT